MSYVESNLLPNERVIASGRMHWWAYAPGTLVTGIGILYLALGSPFFGGILIAIGAILALRAWLRIFSTELAITDRRVIAKFGLIRRSTVELLHRNVESFHVDQGVIGRMLNFGTLVINGTGGVEMPIPNVSAPLAFRRHAQMAIETATRS